MPTILKKKTVLKTDNNNVEVVELEKDELTFMEAFFRQILNISLLILFFRVATAIVAGFIFRGYWRIIFYKDIIPVIAFTEKIEEFRVINAFSVFFMNIVIFLIFFKIFLQKIEYKTVKMTAWYLGVIMAVATHILNVYFSYFSERFGILQTIDKPIIVYLIVTTLLFITYLTFKKKKSQEPKEEKVKTKKAKKIYNK